MTPLPDWLVERAALEEVAPHSRERIDRADPKELESRIAELRAENDAELAAYPAAQAIALIEARVAAMRRRKRRTRLALIGVLGAATAAFVVVAAIKPPQVHLTERSEGSRVRQGTLEQVSSGSSEKPPCRDS